jgi:hypothetical protein
MHQIYFILADIEQIAAIVRHYAADEGLPVPQL